MGQAWRVGTGRVDAVKDGRLPGLDLVGKGFRTAGRRLRVSVGLNRVEWDAFAWIVSQLSFWSSAWVCC
jgi:hypothetical protein